jgi:hypothetical protein
MDDLESIFGRFTVQNISVPIAIRLPVDALAWGLYENEPGAEEAATELTEALIKALQTLSVDDGEKIMSEVQQRYAALGACDSEVNDLVSSYMWERVKILKQCKEIQGEIS